MRLQTTIGGYIFAALLVVAIVMVLISMVGHVLVAVGLI
jgi:hypothetical protein